MADIVKLYNKNSSSVDARRVVINVLGDSITYGVGSGTEFEKTDYKPYYYWWTDDYNVEVFNCGESGSRVAEYYENKGYQPNNSLSFVKRVSEMPDNNPDIILIMGGTNDCQCGYNTDTEFGLIDDKSQKDISTFCGALRTMLDELIDRYHDSKVIYLTPLKYGEPWERAEELPIFINAIKKICSDYKVPVIDCYTPQKLHFCDDTSDCLIFGDHLHFGRTAHKILSDYIMEQLVTLNIVNLE